MGQGRDPRRELDPDTYLMHDEWTLAIYDKFEKARFHFLVLPRLPFPLPSQSEEQRDAAGTARGGNQADPDDESPSKKPKT